MVYRIFVEKKEELANEAHALLEEARTLLGLSRVTRIRLLNRYDVEGVDEALFAQAVRTVLSEPQLDLTYEALDAEGGEVFAVEYLPGQFDQRADSAAQCIQILSQRERPTVRSARVYVLYGEGLTREDVESIKHHVINPVEAREASLATVDSLEMAYDVPESVPTVDGFIALDTDGLYALCTKMGFAMDADDLAFCQAYFREEGRDPTVTELRMIDTYWSDHCRHTTFLTSIDEVTFEDDTLCAAWESYLEARREVGREHKPINLMDVATIATRVLKKRGLLDKLDESEEINACTVKIDVTVDGKSEPWLLLFKNETHNHPTEIEPFGGAATCIGGAIRDPLSGRSYVYGAMRVTGAGNPLRPIAETREGKLPQRKIVTTAAAGYSSYGNQIGLATGQVSELYHEGYTAKRMEIGAVIAAAPASYVRRECPISGDRVILLGGRTGRDGCGGATGSSKSHTTESLTSCGAEVQKGNAPEERKLQRLFRNPEVTRLIKRCNDFGAGGVSVAIGELADGLLIDLNAVPKKYEGLDGTELAISESQERMAVVVAEEDVAKFLTLAAEENLEATVVAKVTEEKRLTMTWNGKTIVDISREFLNSNGAEKHMTAAPAAPVSTAKALPEGTFEEKYKKTVTDLNVASGQGLSERFDSTIGAGGVLMPFGGCRQKTPVQAMVQKISMERGDTDDCSYMAWGFNPMIAEKSPYHSAYLAVCESVSRLIATGASFEDVYLTFQEYFEKPKQKPERFGKPLAALLGAYRAQMDLGIASIGGKDSMSGSFEDLDVPPTLVSFAVTTGKIGEVVSPELKAAGHTLVLLSPERDADGLPLADSLKKLYATVHALTASGRAVAAYTPSYGGVAEALFKMAIGNGIGVCLDEKVDDQTLFGYAYGAFVLELIDENLPENAVLLGKTVAEEVIARGVDKLDLCALTAAYEGVFEEIYPMNPKNAEKCTVAKADAPADVQKNRSASVKAARPRVLIPVFPGTNCEYDSARAVRDAGGEAELFVVQNLTSEAIASSVERFALRLRESQMLFVPGGFSGGDEPDGSGKFITSFLRSGAASDAVADLLDRRGGLVAGICNGFQALIKLGLVPYGRITEPDEHAPTLTFNTIGRHQSRLVRTRIASNLSPFLAETQVGDVFTVPISHGEGRFLCEEKLLAELIKNGQIATQYVDMDGNPTMDIAHNPNGSTLAVEGITSPDGRVFGKMGHSERIGKGLYKNVDGNYDIGMFRSAVKFFK